MNTTPTMSDRLDLLQRHFLLNLKCLFWCVHQLGRQYDLNLVAHSLAQGRLHPEIEDSNLGDNIRYLMKHISPEGLIHVQHGLTQLARSRASVDVGDKHFEVGHYVQALDAFGPIAEGTYGIICSVTPEMRGLFYLEDGNVMEAEFAPSDVRVIFGTYVR